MAGLMGDVAGSGDEYKTVSKTNHVPGEHW